MQFTKPSLLALALSSPVLSCVSFSLNVYQTQPSKNQSEFDYNINAALSDNGGSPKCYITNQSGTARSLPISVPLFCVSGYSASFSFLDNVVQYSAPGFSGSFATTESHDGMTTYHTARVFGC